ncbi:DUF1488 domain-containing protein [Roseomonas sp. HJA6]|uniref:DUF1488 domain-containing protein n=1 Tax=Roseomonas alba TaxID=2846776 RepID=A0ABS7A3G5_9PROT|nr:DUF1488 family protein [Neoroseomonas alba]MBW6396849.1 DUF1488 domain-containing protein [Neoroseomonas alba]
MNASTSPSARWDGHRVLFELRMNDGEQVRCAISRLALFEVSGGGTFRSDDILRRFSVARLRIEAAARAKLQSRDTPPIGVLHIWEDDVLNPPPPASSPCAMKATRRRD